MRTSLLAGKLFDETGDRLTPSHTKKNGKRLRYYVSHRLVTGCAQDLETGVAEAIKRHLGQPSILGRLTHAPTASWLQQASTQFKDLNAPKAWLALAGRIDIQPGKMQVQLDRDACAALLKVVADDIREDSLAWELPFRTRKRGVETKLHLGVETPANIDQTLVQNIIKAQDYLHRIITGQTFAEIAAAEATSKRRIQDLVDLALLSPDILGQIASGTQPEHLTTDYLLKTGFSADWSKQAAQFAIA